MFKCMILDELTRNQLKYIDELDRIWRAFCIIKTLQNKQLRRKFRKNIKFIVMEDIAFDIFKYVYFIIQPEICKNIGWIKPAPSLCSPFNF